MIDKERTEARALRYKERWKREEAHKKYIDDLVEKIKPMVTETHHILGLGLALVESHIREDFLAFTKHHATLKSITHYEDDTRALIERALKTLFSDLYYDIPDDVREKMEAEAEDAD